MSDRDVEAAREWMDRQQEAADRKHAAAALVGKKVVFAHRPPGYLPALVLSANEDGMLQLEGWSGDFAPHLFVEMP